MKTSARGIGRSMVVIAVLAFDFAVGRAMVVRNDSFGWNLLCMEAVAPIVLSLQLALMRIVSIRGRRCAFWIGFLLFGLLAMFSVIGQFIDPPSESTSITSSGTIVRSSYAGGPMARLWSPYLEVVYQGLERLGYVEFDRVGWRSSLVNCFVFFIPQVSLAFAGGLVARAMKKGVE